MALPRSRVVIPMPPAQEPKQATVVFLASYEDRVKVRAACERQGAEGEYSYFDYVEPSDAKYATGQRFDNLEAAVAWLQAEIEAEKTVCGLGDVRQIELTPPALRCDYCICSGRKEVKQYTVGEAGIEDQTAGDDCLSEGG